MALGNLGTPKSQNCPRINAVIANINTKQINYILTRNIT